MKFFDFFKKKEKPQACVQDHAEDECMCVVKAVICGQDEDGYGMTDDEEVDLRGSIDRKGRVVEKFRLQR